MVTGSLSLHSGSDTDPLGLAAFASSLLTCFDSGMDFLRILTSGAIASMESLKDFSATEDRLEVSEETERTDFLLLSELWLACLVDSLGRLLLGDDLGTLRK